MRFELKAVDASSSVVALSVDAHDESQARAAAALRGLTVLTVQARGGALMRLRSRAGQFPAALFATELLALLDAGLNAVEALQALAENEPDASNRQVLERVLDALRRGESLSGAFGRDPQSFPTLFTAAVRSSEQSGDLAEALGRYITYREAFDRVRAKVISALIYPAVLAVVGLLVIAFLMGYVVPRFARVYEDMGSGLPFFSSLLLAVGRAIEQNGALAAVLAVAVLAAAVHAASHQGTRARIGALLWRIPALGARMRIYQLARLYRTVGMLLRAGIPALRAFEMAGEGLPPMLRASLGRAADEVRDGRAMSEALTGAGLTTPVATRMMVVGERSGGMGEMMDRIARFYDEETARALDAFTRIFEPILMALLGFAVGAVVVLMYMPVFELAGSLQ